MIQENLTKTPPRGLSPSVAVLMATYRNDDVDLLALAIDSILVQSHVSLRLFLIVDGYHSTAGEGYLATLDQKRITILRNPVCRGLAASLNTLIDHTVPLGFEYFARMDADDLSLPDRVERQVRYFEGHPDVDVLGCWCYETNVRGDRLGVLQKAEHQSALRASLPLSSPFIHSSVMFRRRVFVHHRYPVDQFMSEDFALWRDLQRAGLTFANLQEPLLEYRRDANFNRRRSQWKRLKCETRIRCQCLMLPGLLTPMNCLGVLVRAGAQLVMRIAPRGLATQLFRLHRDIARVH